MYCSECGNQLTINARFCSNCGQAAKPIVAVHPQARPTASPVVPVDSPGPTEHGTMWLGFWAYFSLPFGALANVLLLMAVNRKATLTLALVLIPYAILQIAVAYGLHKRRLWAWQLNWGIIVVTYIVMCSPIQLHNRFVRGTDLLILIMFKVVVFGLAWLWPNLVYWSKRRALFS